MIIAESRFKEILMEHGLGDRHIDLVLEAVGNGVNEETARNIGRIIGDTVRSDSQKS